MYSTPWPRLYANSCWELKLLAVEDSGNDILHALAWILLLIIYQTKISIGSSNTSRRWSWCETTTPNRDKKVALVFETISGANQVDLSRVTLLQMTQALKLERVIVHLMLTDL
jgi:hypothetical protein